MDFGTGIGSLDYSRIWFLPSQKDKMLNAIMEDIKNLMQGLQKLNEEIIVNYEFSEDFRRVILYVIPPKLALPESPTNEVDVTRPIYIANSVYFTDEMNKRLDIYCEISSFEFEDGIQECVDRLTIFRIVQSINSPQAETFKQWFAELAEERIEEYMNPALAIDRARDRYLERGYSPEWINSRVKSITYHSQLLDEWANRGATTKEYEKLSNTISKETFGVTTQEHKELKNVTDGSLRDNMSQMELLITSLAELTTSELHKSNNSHGLDELNEDAVKGGRAANFAKEQIEITLGKPVLTSENASNFTQPLLTTKDNAPK
jgi:hypothetical protein